MKKLIASYRLFVTLITSTILLVACGSDGGSAASSEEGSTNDDLSSDASSSPDPDDSFRAEGLERCFNPKLYEEGSVLVHNSLITGSQNYRQRMTVTTLAPGQYRGQEVQRAEYEYRSSDDGFATIGSVSHIRFYKSDNEDKIVNLMAYDYYKNPMFSSPQEMIPPIGLKFKMAENDSFSQEYTIMTLGVGSLVSDTTTFFGVEEVSVPAGTYETCYFENVSKSDATLIIEKSWVGVDSGVEIKNIVYIGDENQGRPENINDSKSTFFIELESATLNGVPL